MSYSGDAAEQVVRMSLQGAEVAAKITGAGAKQVAILIYAVLREQKKTKGKIRLTNMLKSGKELKVFAVKDDELERFCTEAKKYGVLYCVLKDKNATDGITDIMVRAEDASKINRIFERFKLATVDIGSIKNEIEKEQSKVAEKQDKTESEQDKVILEDEKSPFAQEMEKSRPSEPTSKHKEQTDKGISDEKRKSVRDELRKIQKKRKSTAKKAKVPEVKKNEKAR